jgi:hypothetical protein
VLIDGKIGYFGAEPLQKLARRGRADGDRGVDDARVVTKLSDRGGAVCGRPGVAARCRGGAKREVPAETWGDGRGCALTL